MLMADITNKDEKDFVRLFKCLNAFIKFTFYLRIFSAILPHVHLLNDYYDYLERKCWDRDNFVLLN